MMATILRVFFCCFFKLFVFPLTRRRAKQKLASQDPVTSQLERAKLPDEFPMKHGERIAEG